MATKFGNIRDKDGNITARNDPEYIRSAIESSLKRLQTDYIDLFYCHRLTGEIPIEEITSLMVEFVK